jgi:hypothetical protein
LSKEKSPPAVSNTTDKHLEKANSLLDELSREEKSGFKAELGLVQESSTERLKNQKPAPVKRTPDEIEENYDGDDFDDIDEDLPDNEIDGSGNNIGMRGIGESHGITVSQSLGIDPSVDSLALEDYDHIEPVEKLQN